MYTNSYTLLGSEQLEMRIDQHMETVSSALVKKLGAASIESLILMGGYGRGEGAVIYRDGEEDVFNDYDFFLVMKTKVTEYQKRAVAEVAESLTLEIGIEIDLFPISMKKFCALPLSLMNFEIKQKSIIVLGNTKILDELPEYNASEIPIVEGTRLLMNRGILLLYCRRALAEQGLVSVDEREKLIKYIFKALLAIGDSYLLINNAYNYHISARKRWIAEQDSSSFSMFDSLKETYIQALGFKIKVDYTEYDRCNLISWLDDTITLYKSYYHWYEELRLKEYIPDDKHYRSQLLIDGIMTAPFKIIKNLLLSLKLFKATHVINHPLWALCYPRQRLYAMLPPLLLAQTDLAGCNFLIDSPASAGFNAVFQKYWDIWLKYS